MLNPLLETQGLDSQVNDFYFFLLVLSCLFIAAGGYIINDIFDRNIDRINKPEKIIVGEKISIRTAENIYIVLNLVSITIGVYLSYSLNLRSLSLIFPIIAGILYFYSSTYKSQVLIGNIIVAVLSAFVPLTIALFELPLLKRKYDIFIQYGNLNFNNIIYWFFFYSAFAFLLSFFREIIKDIEDFEGDTAYGKNTLPVVRGTTFAKVVCLIILGITIFLLLFLIVNYLNDPISFVYLISFVVLPLVYVVYILIRAKVKDDYHKISKYTKIVMLTGLGYIIIVKALLL